MKKELILSLFVVAGIEVIKIWKIENKYWPDHENYTAIRKHSPWWLVKTSKGLIEIGNRKRVTSINWEDTGIELIVTQENVTKGLTYVHAYSEEKIIEYLKLLGKEIN